jgi:hypothetical protein
MCLMSNDLQTKWRNGKESLASYALSPVHGRHGDDAVWRLQTSTSTREWRPAVEVEGVRESGLVGQRAKAWNLLAASQPASHDGAARRGHAAGAAGDVWPRGSSEARRQPAMTVVWSHAAARKTWAGIHRARTRGGRARAVVGPGRDEHTTIQVQGIFQDFTKCTPYLSLPGMYNPSCEQNLQLRV